MVLNAAVLTWFTFFALGLSTYIGAAIFKAIFDGGGFLGGTFNVLGEATRYCVVMLLMAIICFQAPTLASALTGGAAVQQGIQMIQNAMVVAGLRKRSNAGDAGGTVRGGTGIHYSAGRAAGVAAAAARRYSAPAAAKASAAVRTAAQRWAAMRSSD
jgi:type IV secretion system protein VirB6